MPPLNPEPGAAPAPAPGPRYYRSLAELEGSPEYRALLAREFPGVEPEWLPTVTRRRFLQLLGASALLAAASGCSWKEDKILPGKSQPVERVPGVPVRYATAMELSGVAQPLVVTCYDGRPIKVDGNPEHPQSRGGSTVFAQAAILGLYDPDRSKEVLRIGPEGAQPSTWEKFEEWAAKHFAELRAKGGEGLAFLSELSSSPTLADLRTRMKQSFPRARWCEYEPFMRENENREWISDNTSRRVRPCVDLKRAQVVLCLDEDLFAGHPNAVEYARDFASLRDPDGPSMVRLYVVESVPSLTGAMADHRLALRSEQILPFAQALYAEIVRLMKDTSHSGFSSVKKLAPDQATESFLSAVAADLVSHEEWRVVACGARQPSVVHELVRGINAQLGNSHLPSFSHFIDEWIAGRMSSFRALVSEMEAGRVSTLVLLGGNPVYNSPADVPFAAAMEKVQNRIRLGLYCDETSRACTWHLPQSHFLESWGDSYTWDRCFCLTQPLIQPLYGGRSALELLGILGSDPLTKGMDLVRRSCLQVERPQNEANWRYAVHDGFLGTGGPDWAPPSVPEAKEVPARAFLAGRELKNGELELVFYPDPKVYDGRFANNAWLQELPDPLTKLTWDNAALFAPATAKVLGVAHGTIVCLKSGGREIEIPAYVQPGHPEGSIAVACGYGRTHAGHVGGAPGVPSVGVNAYRLRTAAGGDFVTDLEVIPTGRPYPFAVTQEHHVIDTLGIKERAARVGEIIREADLATYRQTPDFAQHMGHHAPLASTWQEHTYTGHRWGFGVDLNRCTGCQACVLACQAENNSPVVGKDQVARGREMHWLRIDRYFRGPAEAPQVVYQPVLCQHCELAPCEQVCPVAATVHDAEGLNAMTYNRCVGTRYCSNNCPYKVRRFNWFNFQKHLEEPRNEVLKMAFNPDVTVRSRGVMEKCTFCVQRIQQAKIAARKENRALADGEITPACVQACPTGALVFGDLNLKPGPGTPGSRVWQLHASPRAYALLAELNTRPRVAYLARVRNPNPKLAE